MTVHNTCTESVLSSWLVLPSGRIRRRVTARGEDVADAVLRDDGDHPRRHALLDLRGPPIRAGQGRTGVAKVRESDVSPRSIKTCLLHSLKRAKVP